MRIGVIQLSDIHIKGSTDPVLNRGNAIANSALGTIPSADAYLLALTGDFASTGLKAQYQLVQNLIGTIQQQFQQSSRQLFIALTPGNHDLDFTNEPDTRPLLLASLPEKISALDTKGETVKQLVSIQNAFFDFEAAVLNTSRRTPEEYVFRSHSFQIADRILRVNSYNTAWVSTNPENPGQLFFPIATTTVSSQPSDLTISIFHHPYNWLSPDNARLFRQTIESSSDIVLTGHEHKSDIYEKHHSEIEVVQYVEGGVLQETGTERSEFNMLSIDTEEGTYESFLCDWQKNSYVASHGVSHQFIRNSLVCKSRFNINKTFLDTLNDPALPISHLRKHDVQLDDLFISPAISYRTLDTLTVTPKMIYSGEFLEHLRL